MAIYYSRSKKKGKLADSVFSIVKGKTIERSAAVEPANPKTEKQYSLRMRWANVISAWNSMQLSLQGCFEFKAKDESDYNRFVSLNIKTGQPIFLTKEQAALKGCIIAPYLVSEGSLRSIKISGTKAGSYTDIVLGSLVIDADTTIGALSQAILENNGLRFKAGDNICYISALQDVAAESHVPMAVVNRFRLHLDLEDTRKVWDTVASWGFVSVAKGSVYVLGHGASIGTGGFAWIHTRLVGNRPYVSTQRLICDNDDLLDEYSSNEQFNVASESYGAKGAKTFFIDDSGGGSISQTQVAPLVSSLKVGHGASVNIALGALSGNFATKSEKAFSMSPDEYFALVIKGTSLDRVSKVWVNFDSLTYGVQCTIVFNVSTDAYEGSGPSQLLLAKQYADILEIGAVASIEIAGADEHRHLLWGSAFGINDNYHYIEEGTINNQGAEDPTNPGIQNVTAGLSSRLTSLSNIKALLAESLIHFSGSNLAQLSGNCNVVVQRIGEETEVVDITPVSTSYTDNSFDWAVVTTTGDGINDDRSQPAVRWVVRVEYEGAVIYSSFFDRWVRA